MWLLSYKRTQICHYYKQLIIILMRDVTISIDDTLNNLLELFKSKVLKIIS